MKTSNIIHKLLLLLLLAVMFVALVKCVDFPMPLLPPEDQSTELISDGKLLYTIVRSDTGSAIVKQAAQHIKSSALSQGIEAKLSNFGTKDTNAYEILIGKTKYFPDEAIKDIDVENLGMDGYLIKRHGSKILIVAQNDKALLSAVDYFTDNFLDVAANKTSMPKNYLHINSSGRYTPALKLAGAPITEYALTASTELSESLSDLSEMIKTKTGYTLTDSGSKKIILTTEGAQGDIITAGFENGNLVIRARTPEQMKKAVVCFWYENLAHKTGNIDLSADLNYSRDLSETVFYSDFNVTQSNDQCCLLEMLEAHNYANTNGYKIFADHGAEYYLSTARKAITIKTDVEWGNARITIDDSKITTPSDGTYYIFEVRSDKTAYYLSENTITSINRDMTNLGITLPERSIITFKDSTKKQYIRYGANANSGSIKSDSILVNTDGSIDMNAPIMWDFDNITSISVLPIDETVLTISGGIFTTISNTTNTGTYYTRGIRVRRSNTIIDSLTHYVTGEGDVSDPYSGFFSINTTANVKIKNCILTGRRYYGIGGTYDFNIYNSINTSLINCSQTNDIADTAYWGIMGGNYIKNVIYDSCSLSRFDAHSGVTNVTIKNSMIGHMGVSVVGYGTLLVEDTFFLADKIIQLRNDYGAFWDGDIFIKNCYLMPKNTSTVHLILGYNNPYHDFGYQCNMPTNVIIDGLTVSDASSAYVFSNYDYAYSEDYIPAYNITQVVSIKNSNIKPVLSPNAYLNSDIEYIYE